MSVYEFKGGPFDGDVAEMGDNPPPYYRRPLPPPDSEKVALGPPANKRVVVAVYERAPDWRGGKVAGTAYRWVRNE